MRCLSLPRYAKVIELLELLDTGDADVIEEVAGAREIPQRLEMEQRSSLSDAGGSDYEEDALAHNVPAETSR